MGHFETRRGEKRGEMEERDRGGSKRKYLGGGNAKKVDDLF